MIIIIFFLLAFQLPLKSKNMDCIDLMHARQIVKSILASNYRILKRIKFTRTTARNVGGGGGRWSIHTHRAAVI